ncbi:MAG TPA: DUF6526 family protein [Thermoanaerobaculia bacterium]|jgi:hypothetical protein|nr:DUF6526 family protein [Thermoanaerobaculia bacterium]
MSQQTPQNYANHARFVPLFHFVTFGILVINLLARLWQLISSLIHGNFAAYPGSWFWLLLNFAVAAALVLLAWYARTFPLMVQNRIIRLEERIRLERLLPEDLRGRIGDLTVGQLVGLRFASDGEVADLVRRVLAGELKTNDQVKRAVQSWRADHVRA